MSRLNIIRAWKDEEYLGSLSETERVLLPQNPAGFVELSNDDLGGVGGATGGVLGTCYSCSACITIDCDITALNSVACIATANQSTNQPK